MKWTRSRTALGGFVVALAALGTTAAARAGTGGNGQLDPSTLAPIYHPTFNLVLRRDAAASWNAMRSYIRARGTDIYPAGRISAYRSYAEQVEAKRLYGSNAATPGTSNHGWGLAVDLATPAMRHALDQYGESFGWAKKWSDASWEWWHIKYREGVWSGSSSAPAPPPPSSSVGTPTLRRGARGAAVATVQSLLGRHGIPVAVDGDFGPLTDAAVRRFQASHGLVADGIVGPLTWGKLRAP
jgi:hypothetical protein